MFNFYFVKGTKGFAMFVGKFTVTFKYSGLLTIRKGSGYRIIFEKQLF